MGVYVRWRTRNGVRRQRDVQAILDAVAARKIAARFCDGNDVVRAEGISGFGEGNGEHRRATVLERTNYAAEERHDKAVGEVGKYP